MKKDQDALFHLIVCLNKGFTMNGPYFLLLFVIAKIKHFTRSCCIHELVFFFSYMEFTMLQDHKYDLIMICGVIVSLVLEG